MGRVDVTTSTTINSPTPTIAYGYDPKSLTYAPKVNLPIFIPCLAGRMWDFDSERCLPETSDEFLKRTEAAKELC